MWFLEKYYEYYDTKMAYAAFSRYLKMVKTRIFEQDENIMYVT